ncbi:hypothetical protein B7440_07585 [Escherichia coli]|nr:hypothetical protein B7440_07585 [Escherichia coli]
MFVNGKKTISFEQFLTINSNLVSISDTWADLWALIFHTGLSAGRLLSIRYDDIDGDLILIRKQGHLKELRVKSTPPVEGIIARRRERYPEDVFWHCCKVSDEAAFCLIQRPYISKTLLTRRISPRGSP